MKSRAGVGLDRWRRFGHVALSLALTVLLVVFLVFARWLDARQVPDRVVRLIEVMPEVVLAAPPPPPASSEEAPDDLPPPPPVEIDLPQLELQIEAVAPALVARLDPNMDLSMQTAEFDLEVDPLPAPRESAPPVTMARTSPAPSRKTPTPAPAPVVRSSYDAGELDATPRLVNRPSASFPRSQSRAGVKEGKVLLEVSIGTSGSVTVRRVISSSHADFSTMARQFAARARFSVPKKNGKPVTAIYRWPLILRP